MTAIATAYCICKTCGQEFTARITGANRNDADFKASWASKNYDECPACFAERMKKGREEKQKEYDRQNAEAMLRAEDQGLPKLNGTPKQIAWATSIRENCLSMFDKAISEGKTLNGDPKLMKIAKRARIAIIDYQDGDIDTLSAAFWINNRERQALKKLIQRIVNVYYKED